jgi:D-sedoheptulose 7-phosphate isomerase
MEAQDRILRHFTDHAETAHQSLELLGDRIAQVANRMSECLINDGKILCCGNGGSATESQHLSSELLNRFERDRPGLPAIPLTADMATITSIANDYCYEEIFAKQIRALGHSRDILVVYTTSGNSKNLFNAVNAAHDRDMTVVLMNGKDGGALAPLLRESDFELRVPSMRTAHVQEMHLLITHCICDLIDHHLFG